MALDRRSQISGIPPADVIVNELRVIHDHNGNSTVTAHNAGATKIKSHRARNRPTTARSKMSTLVNTPYQYQPLHLRERPPILAPTKAAALHQTYKGLACQLTSLPSWWYAAGHPVLPPLQHVFQYRNIGDVASIGHRSSPA
eukprot:CAMPEP_0204282742 /NCGR_PEP_ID=MMETSP0468-20130131/44335_1 /ASSEMBLY_ACC=CAM_ASM_000383 /TAXON_ID=2969 /ORGANISM="Oxyrrhis marina" /LENGTH=141 /DNA_ID=CAMNT_0051260281 /DNA_START=608 /DNA_END=1031 /DNA_ORIENTATION=+